MRKRYVLTAAVVVSLFAGIIGVQPASAGTNDTVAQPAWTQLAPGAIIGSTAALQLGPESEVGYTNADGSTSISHFHTTYGAPVSLGGISLDGPAISKGVGAGHDIAVFVHGQDGAVWFDQCKKDLTGCTGFQTMGGLVRNNVAAVKFGADNIVVFARGIDDQLWTNTVNKDTGPGTWAPLGGILTSGPGADNDNNNLAVAVVGNDGQPWLLEASGSDFTGQSFSPLGGLIVGAPAVAADPGNHHLLVFGRGIDDALWFNSRGASTFDTWESLGGILRAGPGAAVFNGNNNVQLVAHGQDDQTWVAQPALND